MTTQERRKGREEEFARIPLTKFDPPAIPTRLWRDQRYIEYLARDIKAKGVIEPLLVRRRGSRYEVVAGENRRQAALLAGLEDVPCMVTDMNDQQAIIYSLTENLARDNLDPISEAALYKRLIEREGLLQKEVAQLFQLSEPVLSKKLALLELPNEVQAMVVSGELHPSTALLLRKIPDKKVQVRTAGEIAERAYSHRQAQVLVDARYTELVSTPETFEELECWTCKAPVRHEELKDYQFYTFTRSWRVPHIFPHLEELRALPNFVIYASTDRDTRQPPPGWLEACFRDFCFDPKAIM